MYGRGGEKGVGSGIPRWREAGEKGKNYATSCNNSQSKKCKEAETEIKGYRKGKV